MKWRAASGPARIFGNLVTLLVCVAANQLGWAADVPPKPPDKQFFVIAPDAFLSALTEYVQYKRSVRPTTLVSLESILDSAAGADDPERLKRFLYDAWRKERLGYVLLVGDVDVMPVRYMVTDRTNVPAFDYAFYPSDLYYADLARRDGSFDDWNAVKEGFHRQYIGEVHGETIKTGPINFDQVTYQPKIAFGRWPVSTEQQVRNVATKTIAYEKGIRDATHPGSRRVDFFNTQGYVDVRDKMNTLVTRDAAGLECGPCSSTRTTRNRIARPPRTGPMWSMRSTREPR